MKYKNSKAFFLKLTKSLVKRDFRVFLICLLISFFSWVIMELSDSFYNETEMSVNYSKSPEGLILLYPSDSIFRIHLESIGFELLNLTIGSEITTNLDLSSLKPEKGLDGKYTIKVASSVFEDQLRKQLGMGIRAKIISPDTLQFVFDDLITKKVGVKCNYSLSYKQGFKLLNAPQITPDSVEIRGSKSKLEKINKISTERIVYKNLKEDKTNQVRLVYPKDISWISNKKVDVYFDIEQFTQSKSTLPIYVRNHINNQKIKTFPSSIEITYNLPIKYFQKVSDTMFRVEVVMDSLNIDQQQKMIPKLVKKPYWVDNVIFNTEVVDFIILK